MTGRCGTRDALAKEFFMPRCGATFDENVGALSERGLVYSATNPPRRFATAVVR